MARPTSKKDLLKAAATGFEKLQDMMASLTERELRQEFCFLPPEKYKEIHWKRDKNLRDVLIHLYEWHQLLLTWVEANSSGETKPFLPEPYNWKTYGEMNLEFWRRHQTTSLEQAKTRLQESHRKVMDLIASFSDEALFHKGMFKWTGGTTLGSYCVSVSASHYDWAIKKLKAHKKNLSV